MIQIVSLKIGKKITFDEFYSTFEKMIGRNYSNYEGSNIRDLEAISRNEKINKKGIITKVLMKDWGNSSISVSIELDYQKDNLTETFSSWNIYRILQNHNQFYLVYLDDSYYRLVIE